MAQTAKVFKSGRSQAVRLPREFRFDVDEVYIHRQGDLVILSPRPRSWRSFFEEVPLPTPDFMEERADPELQERDDLL